MTTAFDALLQGADASLQAAFGERFRHRPRRAAAGPHGKESADPDRVSVEFSGIFSLHAAPLVRVDAFDRQTDQRPGSMGGEANVEIAAGDAVNPRVGDQIERLADDSLWRIIAQRPDDQRRILCHLRRM